MTFTRDDFKRLRLSIAAALLLTAAGAGCLVASDQYLAEANKARLDAKARRDEAQKRVERVAEEEREIRENLVFYNRMVQRGMASQENRLDLIDAIAKIKNDRRLFEIRYNIAPQKPLDYAGIKPSGALDLVTSRMRLEMLLLHEGDLFDFLGDLVASGRALVSVRDCTVTRVDRGGAATSASARLRSECDVDLIALRQVRPS